MQRRREPLETACVPALEPLEPRLLLDADVIFSEIFYQSFTENGHPEDLGKEWIELHNRGDATAEMLGWAFVDGIDFEFPDVTLPAGGYLVVPSNPDVFHTEHPGVSNYVSAQAWEGRLSNSGENVELADADGRTVDRVEYADDGDWSVRERVQDSYGMEGYAWSNAHDGGGKSLELIVLDLETTNNSGQNWAASLPDGGTPGAPNSIAADEIAPLIRDVEHYPVIPRPWDPITVRAEVTDELANDLTVRLHYRRDGDPDFTWLAMLDNGLGEDDWAGDGVFTATIDRETFSHGMIVEFYVEAVDLGATARTWPAPVRAVAPVTGGGQIANCLFQVDENFDPDAEWVPGTPPEFLLITPQAEWDYFLPWADDSGVNYKPNGQFNATFVSLDGVATKLHYQTGVRNRGNGSRAHHPHNLRINVRHDQPWRDYTALTINAQRPYSQAFGSAVFRYADIPAPNAVQVRTLVNGVDDADTGSDMYGYYAWLESLDGDFVSNHWPDDDAGNLYKCNYYTLGGGRTYADLRYRGEDPDSYRDEYGKQTNVAQDDYDDLIHMLDVVNNAPDATFFEDVAEVIHVEQWARYLAIHAFLSNREGGLLTGTGDDYVLYAGVEDPRFLLVPYDLDSIATFGGGSTTASIFGDYTDLPALGRLFGEGEFVRMYYEQLLDLCETVFAPEIIDPLVDQVLGAWRDSGTLSGLKSWIAGRVTYVRGRIPTDPLTVSHSLPTQGGYPRATSQDVSFTGTADGAHARSITVNGRVVEWDPENAQWSWDGSSSYEERTILTADAPVAYHVPTDLDDLEDWTALGFNDDGWVQSITLDGAGVVLTEIATGETRFVEVQNVSAGAVATTGWSVLVNDASGGINAVNGVGWSLPASLGPGEVLYRTDDPSDNYWQATIDWGAEGPGWAMIVDGAGDVTDFLAWGYTAAEIASLSIDYGAFSGITVGDQWSGDGAAVGTIEEAVAAGGWVAFNDHLAGAGTHAHATTYAANGMASGLLKDISTGANLGATLTITENGTSYEGTQGLPAAGTDAFGTFDGYVDFGSGTGSSLALTGTDHYTHTFSGLDAGDAAIYNFAGTAVRGGTDYADRWTLVRLSGADAATPAHSSGAGVVVLSATQVALWTGENQQADQGFLAAWTDIDPGADGEFSVIASQYTGPTPGVGDGMAGNESPTKAYGLTGIRLEEVSDTPPPPPPEGFVAFNDYIRGPNTHANATTYDDFDDTTDATSGSLRDIETGEDVGVVLTVSEAGIHHAGSQAYPAPGTDAYAIFNGYVDFGQPSNGADDSLEVSVGDHYTYTFSNLDTTPNVTYSFHGSAIRGNSSYADRWTLVTLQGATAARPDHSDGNGIVFISDTEVALWTGVNSTGSQGFVVGWTDIDPGTDGIFSVVSTQYTGAIPTSVHASGQAGGSKGYGLSGVRLEEVRPSGPQSWLRREGNTDGNTAGDFARSGADSKGAQNVRMTVPFGTQLPTLQGVGFHDNQPAFGSAIRTDVAEAMKDANASIWTRIELDAPQLLGYDLSLIHISEPTRPY